ncbi:MAG: hypothetical protein E6J00_05660 [Chloroflexi bacterium]|nr:MAG: hypothetical protein E6J00_05660 [Chloroflexota bacterium]
MAITTGFVQRLTWLESGPTACIWLGSTPTSTDLFFIQVRASDSDADVNFKCSMVGLLFQAQVTGRQVDVSHGASSSEVTSAGTPLCNVAATPLQLDAIEVTQAIQSLSQGVPLLAGKRTVVRLYLSWYSTPGISVQGQIAVRQGPGGPSVTVASANTATLDPAQAGSVGPKRNDATRSLNFLLPILQTVEGPLIISVAGLTNSATGAALTLGCETRPTVWFHRSPPLRVRILGMSYTQGMPAVTFTPAAIDFNLLVSWLGRAYPVAQVVSSQAVVTATAAAPFGCGDINAPGAIRARTTTVSSATGDSSCAGAPRASRRPPRRKRWPPGRPVQAPGAGIPTAPTETGTAGTSSVIPSAASIPVSAGRARTI